MARKSVTELDLKMLDKGYASVSRVAHKLGRNIATVYRLIKDGKLTAIMVGEQQYVEIQSVLRYAGTEAVELLELRDWS